MSCPVLNLVCVLRGQGYKQVGVSAALNTGQSVLEICGSIVVLVLVRDSALRRLTSLGLVSLAAAALSVLVGMSPAAPSSNLLQAGRGLEEET